jgi:single-strand DNA-binding protein
MRTTNNTNQIGYLAADPTLKALPSGTPVAEFRLGISQAGNTKDDAGFFDVAVYGPGAEPVAKYLKKGSHVAVHGRLQHRTWKAQDDSPRSAIRIVGQVQFLDRRTRDDEAAAQAIADSIPVDAAPDGDDIPF